MKKKVQKSEKYELRHQRLGQKREMRFQSDQNPYNEQDHALGHHIAQYFSFVRRANSKTRNSICLINSFHSLSSVCMCMSKQIFHKKKALCHPAVVCLNIVKSSKTSNILDILCSISDKSFPIIFSTSLNSRFNFLLSTH